MLRKLQGRMSKADAENFAEALQAFREKEASLKKNEKANDLSRLWTIVTATHFVHVRGTHANMTLQAVTNADSPIRFKFAPEKARAAIELMLSHHPRIDLHAVLKACYFADKAHLNKYGRPVFGATYRAMRFGPVPLEIYEMVKGEPYWLCEIECEQYPWELSRHTVRRTRNDDPDLSPLSESDVEEVEVALGRSMNMSFNERTAATHGPDWQRARLGIMSYEDMIEESPNKAKMVAYLRETGPHIRL